MISKKVKKTLKDWGYKIITENPLKIISTYKDGKDFYSGIPAEIKIKEAQKYLEESEEVDFSRLKTMDDDDYLLVSSTANYADEFDMSEWTTMTVANFKDLVETLKNYTDEIEWGFGTNESMTFNDGEDLLRTLEIKKLTIEEYDVLDKIFGGSFDGGAGVFEHIYCLGDEDNDNEDSEDDNEDSEDEDGEEETFLSNTEIRIIEKLKQSGWSIEVIDEEQGFLEFKNDKGDHAVADSCFIEELFNYQKRNK